MVMVLHTNVLIAKVLAMSKSKTKFKVGDKVRILPSAVDGGVSVKAVGKIGKITQGGMGDDGKYGFFRVRMEYDNDVSWPGWAVCPNQMEKVIEVGQQLLFDFMLD